MTKTIFENKKFVSSRITTSHGNSWRCANIPYKIIEYNREISKLLPCNGKTPIDVLNKNFETCFSFYEKYAFALQKSYYVIQLSLYRFIYFLK